MEQIVLAMRSKSRRGDNTATLQRDKVLFDLRPAQPSKSPLSATITEVKPCIDASVNTEKYSKHKSNGSGVALRNSFTSVEQNSVSEVALEQLPEKKAPRPINSENGTWSEQKRHSSHNANRHLPRERQLGGRNENANSWERSYEPTYNKYERRGFDPFCDRESRSSVVREETTTSANKRTSGDGEPLLWAKRYRQS
eukprot:scaffold1091_cov164-Ochromonas_danica.AAC.70